MPLPIIEFGESLIHYTAPLNSSPTLSILIEGRKYVLRLAPINNVVGRRSHICSLTPYYYPPPRVSALLLTRNGKRALSFRTSGCTGRSLSAASFSHIGMLRTRPSSIQR